MAKPSSIGINAWEDAHQDPVLPTTSSVVDLVPDDNQWVESLWGVRGYPGVFAAQGETPPLMHFCGAVPDGTYTLVANLYWNRNWRYYWGYSAANPEQYSYDVTSGIEGDFAEYMLGTVAVTNGTFDLYIQRADPLMGGASVLAPSVRTDLARDAVAPDFNTMRQSYRMVQLPIIPEIQRDPHSLCR